MRVEKSIMKQFADQAELNRHVQSMVKHYSGHRHKYFWAHKDKLVARVLIKNGLLNGLDAEQLIEDLHIFETGLNQLENLLMLLATTKSMAKFCHRLDEVVKASPKCAHVTAQALILAGASLKEASDSPILRCEDDHAVYRMAQAARRIQSKDKDSQTQARFRLAAKCISSPEFFNKFKTANKIVAPGYQAKQEPAKVRSANAINVESEPFSEPETAATPVNDVPEPEPAATPVDAPEPVVPVDAPEPPAVPLATADAPGPALPLATADAPEPVPVATATVDAVEHAAQDNIKVEDDGEDIMLAAVSQISR